MSLSTKLYSSVDYDNRQVILDLIQRQENAAMLDLGCGSGDFTMEMATKVGAREICGIELLEKAAQKAESKTIKVYRADLNRKFPVDDESFDFVCANQVIEHLYETDLFIKEIHRD